MTLDEVYEKAENVWLKGVLSYGSSDFGDKITFETENNGLISVCGVTPETCYDDCFEGINIIEIGRL